jgi:hypothetical protein
LQEQRGGQQLGKQPLEKRRYIFGRGQHEPEYFTERHGQHLAINFAGFGYYGNRPGVGTELADGFRRRLGGRLELGRRRIGQLERRGSARII